MASTLHVSCTSNSVIFVGFSNDKSFKIMLRDSPSNAIRQNTSAAGDILFRANRSNIPSKSFKFSRPLSLLNNNYASSAYKKVVLKIKKSASHLRV